jgi:secreted Zn-dependent insulinase-like peptidase
MYVLPTANAASGHTLTITWQWPSQQGLYGHKASCFLENLINHNGQGGLQGRLQAAGWAQEVTGSCDDDGFSRNCSAWLFRVRPRVPLMLWSLLFAVVGFSL